MHIDVPEPLPHQLMGLDESHDLFVLGERRIVEGLKKPENLIPVFKIAACQLTDDEWMTDDVAFGEQGRQPGVYLA